MVDMHLQDLIVAHIRSDLVVYHDLQITIVTVFHFHIHDQHHLIAPYVLSASMIQNLQQH